MQILSITRPVAIPSTVRVICDCGARFTTQLLHPNYECLITACPAQGNPAHLLARFALHFLTDDALSLVVDAAKQPTKEPA